MKMQRLSFSVKNSAQSCIFSNGNKSTKGNDKGKENILGIEEPFSLSILLSKYLNNPPIPPLHSIYLTHQHQSLTFSLLLIITDH